MPTELLNPSIDIIESFRHIDSQIIVFIGKIHHIVNILAIMLIEVILVLFIVELKLVI